MKLRGFLTAGALALTLALSGCGGGAGGGGTGGDNTGGGAGGGGVTGGATGGTTLTVGTDTGTANQFVPATVEAPANTAVTLTFTNNSTSTPHNLTFQEGITAKTSPAVAAGASETLQFTTPGAGSYTFVCTLHPGMEGTLTVK